jgi:ABC-type dipeptide/oligopeptide/nickel transport system permease subunit
MSDYNIQGAGGNVKDSNAEPTASAVASAATGGSNNNGTSTRQASLMGDAFRDLRKRPRVIFSVIVIVPILLIAFVPQLFTSIDPEVCKIGKAMNGPTSGHIFGFSSDGCDYYAQTIYGAGPSIKLSLLVTIGTLVIGGLIGVLAGYYGGWVDAVFSRMVDTFNSIPFLLGAILVLTMFRNIEIPFVGAQLAAILPAVFALIFFGWTSNMRLIRASVIESRNLDYVQAARSLGASNRRIMFRHILPNAIAPVMSLIPLTIAGMVSTESVLSFLGIGVQPPAISWGIMIDDATDHFMQHPMMLVIPSTLLVLTVLSFVLLGDAIRDALDPKLR